MGGGVGGGGCNCTKALRHTILDSFPDDFIYLFDLFIIIFLMWAIIVCLF